MKKRTLITIAALLLTVCLPFSACGENPDTPTDEEMQSAMDAGREASESVSGEQSMEMTPETDQQQRVTISADSPERLLYRDDTRIVYTVVTPGDCTEVILSLLYQEYNLMLQLQSLSPAEREGLEMIERDNLWAINTPLYQQSFTPQSEGVTVEEEADSLVWTIPCDFGLTGAERVAAEAVCQGDGGQHPFGIVNVDIRYPSYNIVDEVELAIRAAIEYNRDVPLFFVCDLNQTSLDIDPLDPSEYMNAALFGLSRTTWDYNDTIAESEKQYGLEYGNYIDYVMKAPDVYSSGLYLSLPYFAQIITTHSTNFEYGTDRINLYGLYAPVGQGILLCGIRLGNEDVLLPDVDPNTPTQCMIDPGARALICSRAGIPVNAEDFPSAAAVQTGAEAAIAQCIQPGMTDFEKVKAIFDWMYERSQSAVLPAQFDTFTTVEQSMYYKTPYGFMTEGFGDCMGWSGTFWMLCNMADVKCITVDCMATPGGATLEQYSANHRMNALWLDGEMYYADTYWGAAGAGFSVPQYEYFLITTEQAAESYTWNGNMGIPETTATKYAVDPVTGELLH